MDSVVEVLGLGVRLGVVVDFCLFEFGRKRFGGCGEMIL